MLDFLKQQDLPFAIVATKADKLNKTNRNLCIEALENHPEIPEDVVIIPFSELGLITMELFSIATL